MSLQILRNCLNQIVVIKVEITELKGKISGYE
jgi:hypothetical protein